MTEHGTNTRTTLRTIRRLGTIFVVNIVVLTFLVMGFGREYLRNREISRSIADLEVQNEQLATKKLASLSVIESLSSEYYLEGEARRKHGLAKPGEELVIINDAEAATVTKDGEAMEDGGGNAAKWFLYFFDHETFSDRRAL